MRILITYATTEGQTRRIARHVASRLIEAGHSVEMLAAADAGELNLPLFDAAILAGSVHLGKVQPVLGDFASAHAQTLNAMPTLFLLVSLAVAGGKPEDMAELDRIAGDFAAGAGWTPGQVEHVAGAFRFGQYDFFRALAMRWIAHQKGQEVDPQGDTEYTDWAALDAAVADWAGAI